MILTTPVNQSTKLLDSNRNDPYNENAYPGFDPDNQYIGITSPLDKMYHSKKAISSNRWMIIGEERNTRNLN